TAKAPLIVAANKADNTAREADAAEFWSLGWEETYAISASHGRGTGDLLDAIASALPPESESEIARKQREAEADEWARDVAAGQGRRRAGSRALLHPPLPEGNLAGRRRGPRDRRGRGSHRPGRPRRRLHRRGGQGPRHRGQQVGPGREQDGPDLRPVRRVDP